MSTTRDTVMQAHAGFPSRGGSPRTIAARATLARLLWNSAGERRVPPLTTLSRALAALPAGELAWMSEFSPMGPLYLLPTRPFLRALAAKIRALRVTRLLEVAAGDGHLARALSREAPDLTILASDSGGWATPRGRMTKKEQREHRGEALGGIPLGTGVQKLEALQAIRKFRPQLVLASWLPPGPLLARLIRAPVNYVLEIGAGSGITGDASCWRFAHEFCEGPIENLARCRLDERPDRENHSRVTLYFGARHRDFAEEKLTPDHWLYSLRAR